jgi:hypothetical protein
MSPAASIVFTNPSPNRHRGATHRAATPATLDRMIEQQENRFVSERLRANLASAIRVLDAAERALVTRDAGVANVVLGFEGDARAAIGPVTGTVRGDTAVEGIVDLAMRVADLARVAWRPDRMHPVDDEVDGLRGELDAVRRHAATVIASGFEELSMLTRLVVRADAHAAAMTRTCDLRRLACRAF